MLLKNPACAGFFITFVALWVKVVHFSRVLSKRYCSE